MPNIKKFYGYTTTAKTVYGIIERLLDSYRLNNADGTFAAAPADPYVSATEHSVIKGEYSISEARQSWNDGWYKCTMYEQAGGSPVPVSDIVIGYGFMYIVSDAEVSNETDLSTITAKLPTNYIMGSAVQTAKDDEIDAIPTLSEIEASTILAKEATLANVTYGLAALKSLIDAIDTSTELQVRFTEIKGAGWTTETLKAIKDSIAGGGLDPQQIRDAMKLAPTVGAPAVGSVDAALDDIQAETLTHPTLTEVEASTILAKQATLENVTYGLSALKTLIDGIDTSVELAARFTEIKGGTWSSETMVALMIAIDAISTLISGTVSEGIFQNQITITGNAPQRIARGDVKTLVFNLGTQWNLASKKVYFCVKLNPKAADSTAIINRTCTITSEPNGIAVITTTEAETAIAGEYYADVEVRNLDESSPQTAAQFKLIIFQDVRQ